MGIFLTYSKIDEIKIEIYSFLKKKNIELFSEKDNGNNKSTIIAKGLILKHPLGLIWEIEPYGNSNSVKMEVRPSRSLQIRVFIRALFFMTMFAIFPIMCIKLWNGFNSLPAILIVLFAIFVLSGLLWLKDGLLSDSLKKIESEFRISSKENIDIKVESPPDVNLLPRWLDLVIQICYCFVIFYFLFAAFPIVFYLLLPMQGLLLTNIFLNGLARKENYIIWKYALIGNVFRWTIVALSILVFIIIIYMFNAKLLIEHENEIAGKADISNNVFSISFFEKSMKSFKLQIGDPIKYKINMMEDLIDHSLKKLYKNPGIQDKINVSRYVFSGVVNLGIFAPRFFLYSIHSVFISPSKRL